ncbi:MAG TPA: hypothetical protein VG994_00735 [Steroidobacteraceae bacterium]|nr:hypothetical protein [Steroidobacteraceae bacterium]
MKRRQFMEIMASCAAVSAASWAGSFSGRVDTALAAPEKPAPAHRIDVVIYDARYPDAERFASALAREGATAFATAGEIVTLWRESLATRPDVDGLWIAGLTLHSDFEIARGLAAAHGLRVFHRRSGAPRPPDAMRARPGALTSWLLG